MNLQEFANKILRRYPPDEQDDEFTTDFLKALDIGGNYDYDNAFTELMRSFAFKTTPSAKLIIEILKRNVIKEEKKPPAPVIGSIYADKDGYTYCYGVESEIGEWKTTQWLLKNGFTNLRPLESYLKGAQ